MNRITSITIAGTTALAALALTFWIRSKRKSPEEFERERRLPLSGRLFPGKDGRSGLAGGHGVVQRLRALHRAGLAVVQG